MPWKYVLFEEEQDSCNLYLSDPNKDDPFAGYDTSRTDNPNYALKFNTPDEAAEYCRVAGEHFYHFRIEATYEE